MFWCSYLRGVKIQRSRRGLYRSGPISEISRGLTTPTTTDLHEGKQQTLRIQQIYAGLSCPKQSIPSKDAARTHAMQDQRSHQLSPWFDAPVADTDAMIPVAQLRWWSNNWDHTVRNEGLSPIRLYFCYYSCWFGVGTKTCSSDGSLGIHLPRVDPRPQPFLFLLGNFMGVYQRGMVRLGLFCVCYWLCLLILMWLGSGVAAAQVRASKVSPLLSDIYRVPHWS